MSTNSAAIYDKSILDQLAELDPDNRDFIRELVNQYFQDAPCYLNEILSCKNPNSLEDLIRAAHTLKSTSATLGGLKLAESCALLESCLRSSNTNNLDQMVDRIHCDYHAFKKAIENDLGLRGLQK